MPADERYRVSRARLAHIFERYALREELLPLTEASILLGLSRESIGLLCLQGKLCVAEAVKAYPDERPVRLLLRSEVEALRLKVRQEQLPLG
jgi:hypothetical protein